MDLKQPSGGSLSEALNRVTVRDLLASKERLTRKKKVVVLEHNQTVSQALKVLGTHRILSAPLVISPGLEDLEEGALVGGEGLAPSGQTLLGWVDVADITKALLQHLKTRKGGNGIPQAMLALMSELDAAAPAFLSRTLISLSGGDDKLLVYEGELGASLRTTINDFFLSNAGTGRVVHRLAVFDAHGSIEAIVSQLDVVRYLAHHPLLLGPAANMTLKELGLLPAGPSHVVCVDPHVPTLLALERLVAAGVSGGAVLAGDGALMANLSISDLRCIQPDQLGVLALPVAEFLALLHHTSYLGYSQRSSTQAENPFFAAGPRTSMPSPSSRPASASPLSRNSLSSSGGSGPPPSPGRYAPPPAGSMPSPRAGAGGAPGSGPAIDNGRLSTDGGDTTGVRSRLSGQLSLGAGVPAESPRRLSGRMSSGVVPMATDTVVLSGAPEDMQDLPGANDTVRTISCSQSSTLLQVLRLLADNHVHRVYVTDPHAKPQVIAVITPTDILRWLMSYNSPAGRKGPKEAVHEKQAQGQQLKGAAQQAEAGPQPMVT